MGCSPFNNHAAKAGERAYNKVGMHKVVAGKRIRVEGWVEVG